MNIQTITIQWNSMRVPEQSTRLDFTAFTGDLSDEQICEELYSQTNRYAGSWWSFHIEPVLDTKIADRPHTALSVGDNIEINDGFGKSAKYVCADFGWERVEA